MRRFWCVLIERLQKTAVLIKLQLEAASIEKHIYEDERVVDNVNKFSTPQHVHISASVCPLCHSEKNTLRESAEKLQQAIINVLIKASELR